MCPKRGKKLYEMFKLGQITHLRNQIVIGFQNKYRSGLFNSSSLLLLRIQNKMDWSHTKKKTVYLNKDTQKLSSCMSSAHTLPHPQTESREELYNRGLKRDSLPRSSNWRHLLCYISHQQHNLPEAIFPTCRHKCSWMIKQSISIYEYNPGLCV